MSLPKINKQPIIHIDNTPNKEYALRILKAYRENCDCKWSSNRGNPLIEEMNKAQDKRAKILDRAIQILKENL